MDQAAETAFLRARVARLESDNKLLQKAAEEALLAYSNTLLMDRSAFDFRALAESAARTADGNRQSDSDIAARIAAERRQAFEETVSRCGVLFSDINQRIMDAIDTFDEGNRYASRDKMKSAQEFAARAWRELSEVTPGIHNDLGGTNFDTSKPPLGLDR